MAIKLTDFGEKRQFLRVFGPQLLFKNIIISLRSYIPIKWPKNKWRKKI